MVGEGVIDVVALKHVCAPLYAAQLWLLQFRQAKRGIEHRTCDYFAVEAAENGFEMIRPLRKAPRSALSITVGRDGNEQDRIGESLQIITK